MSTDVVLAVRLKVPDTTALSALDILTRKMGLEGELVGLLREDLWRFRLDTGDADAAAARVAAWAESLTALVNPNKHRARIEVRPPQSEPQTVRVRVEDRVNVRGASMAAFLRKRLGAPDLLELAAGTRWTLRFSPDVENPRASAEAIAVTRARREGLLGNPHAHTIEIEA